MCVKVLLLLHVIPVITLYYINYNFYQWNCDYFTPSAVVLELRGASSISKVGIVYIITLIQMIHVMGMLSQLFY